MSPLENETLQWYKRIEQKNTAPADCYCTLHHSTAWALTEIVSSVIIWKHKAECSNRRPQMVLLKRSVIIILDTETHRRTFCHWGYWILTRISRGVRCENSFSICIKIYILYITSKKWPRRLHCYIGIMQKQTTACWIAGLSDCWTFSLWPLFVFPKLQNKSHFILHVQSSYVNSCGERLVRWRGWNLSG